MTQDEQTPDHEHTRIDLDTELASWRRAHPQATFAEMEDGVRGLLARMRPQLMEQLTASSPDPGRDCPECGKRMQHRGNHTRAIILEDGGMTHLERPYFVCPACGTGLFPPG